MASTPLCSKRATQPSSNVLAPLRSRPGVQLTTARFPDQGATATELWASASAGAPVQQVSDTREGVVVADPAMVQVFHLAKKLAAVQTTVLILGETGVGKELVAEQIHRWSARSRAVRSPELRIPPGDSPRE